MNVLGFNACTDISHTRYTVQSELRGWDSCYVKWLATGFDLWHNTHLSATRFRLH